MPALPLLTPAHSGLQGIFGLEGRHRWDDAVTLNDLSGAFPRYRIAKVANLHALAESDVNSEALIGRMGEIARPGFRRGKTVTYTGFTEALDLPSLRFGQAILGEAFAPTDERQMLITTDPAYSAESRYYTARCIFADAGEDEQGVAETHVVPIHTGGAILAKATAYVRPFTIALRMSDPRVYDAVERLERTAPLVSSGGLLPPFKPPAKPAGVGLVGGTNFDTGGRAPTDPIIDCWGPVTNPRVINYTLGRELRYLVELDEGSFLRLDFAARIATLDGVSILFGRRDRSASNWWARGVDGLQRGTNIIGYSGDAIAEPAHADIRFHPAYVT